MWKILTLCLIFDVVYKGIGNPNKLWEYEEWTFPTCPSRGSGDLYSNASDIDCADGQCTENATIVNIPIHLLDGYTGG